MWDETILFIGIVLAAGLSRRFPDNKLLYLWNNKPVIYWTLKNINESMVEHIVLVTGHEHEKIEKIAREFSSRIDIVYNPRYIEGMSSSVRKGVEYSINKYHSIEALFFTPGDCAWISPTTYNSMINVYRESKPLIIVASYNGRKGHPIMFSSRLVTDLLNVSEEGMGLKSVVKKYYWGLKVVETNDPGVILDLDTYNDLNRVKYVLKK